MKCLYVECLYEQRLERTLNFDNEALMNLVSDAAIKIFLYERNMRNIRFIEGVIWKVKMK